LQQNIGCHDVTSSWHLEKQKKLYIRVSNVWCKEAKPTPSLCSDFCVPRRVLLLGRIPCLSEVSSPRFWWRRNEVMVFWIVKPCS